MVDKQLRFGLIGCGHMGSGHARQAAAAGVNLAAYCDVRLEAAEQLLAELGGDYATSDPERVLDDSSLDAVIIATRHDSHTQLATAAAASGKHILLEKPMANTVAECQAISDAVDQAGVKLAINFKFRRQPAACEVKRLLSTPVFTVGQLCNDRVDPNHWSWQPGEGDGGINGGFCHMLDLVYWFNESEPVRVYAEAAKLVKTKGDYYDQLSGSIGFANGAIGNVMMVFAGKNIYLSKWFCEVFDGTCSAVLHEHITTAEFTGTTVERFNPRESGSNPWGPSAIEDFAQAILENRPPAAGPADGLRATRMARAFEQSARDGSPVSLRQSAHQPLSALR